MTAATSTRTLFLSLLLLAQASSAPAAYDQPQGDVLLTISGLPGPDGDIARFDAAMLAALADDEFTTTTIWTDGPQTFVGVSLHDLMDGLGIEDGTIRAMAVNDYGIEIPLSDARDENGPIVAYLRNGEPMSLRENGPLWIVYPYDIDPAWQTEMTYSRSIWQLDRIEVLDVAR